MIEKVSISSVDKKNTPKKSINNANFKPSFKGGLSDLLVKGIQKCEEHPMLNVSVLDLSTAIIPRTIVETYAGSNKKDENGNQKRQLNFFGGFEAFRRESSGLVINCLLPSFLVMGAGALFNKPVMGIFDKNLLNNWANNEAYDKIAKFYTPCGNPTREYYKDFFKRSILSLEGVDGEAYNKGGIKSFAELLAENPDEIKNLKEINDILEKIRLKPEAESTIDILAKAAEDGDYKNTKKAYQNLVNLTHISENIRFKGDEGYAALKNVKAGNKIVITFEHSGDANYTKVTLQNVVDWQNLDATSELYTEDLSLTTFVYTVSDQTASLIQNGMQVTGENYTLKKVEIQQDGAVTYGFYVPGGNGGISETPFNAANAVMEGTWENEWIESDMEKLYGYLQPLEDAGISVIWRPLHEASGAWFWWGAQGPETYKTLWKMMYDYLVKEKGLDNLIWVWTAEKDDDEWYPGDEYVDIVGRDIYDQAEAYEFAAEFATLAGRYPNKMIALSECGNVANISDMWEAGAKWAWFMVWYPGSATGDNSGVTWEQFATTEWWSGAFSQDYVIARE